MSAADAFVSIAMLALVALAATALLIREQRRADEAEVRAEGLRRRAEIAEMWADEFQTHAFRAQREADELRALNAEKTRMLLAKNYYVIEQHVRRRQR
jgi:lysyl-tRNA synthetase class I